MKHEERLYLVFIALIGSLCLAIFTFRYGVYVSPDSVNYLTAGQNFAQGQGIYSGVIHWLNATDSKPLHFWPPFYPIALAGLFRLGLNILAAAWWLNLILFALNIYLVGSVILEATGSVRWSIWCSALFLFSYPAYHAHSFAWSEPLSLTLLTLSFIYLNRYLLSYSWRALLTASVFAALCWLTRYAGVTVVGTALFCIMLWSEQSWLKRLRAAAVFGLISVLPLLFWGYRNYKLLGDFFPTAAAIVEQNEAGLKNLWRFAQVVSHWFFPYFPAAVAAPLCFLLLAAVFIPVIRGWRRLSRTVKIPLLIWAVYLGIYLGFMLITFYQVQFAFDDRYLSLILPPLLILVLSCLHSRPSKLPKYGYSALILVIALPMLWRAGGWAKESWREGMFSYTDRSWRESPTVRWLNTQPPERTLFSASYDALLILTKHKARDLPWLGEEDILPGFAKAMRYFNGFLVCIDKIDRQYFVTEADLVATGWFTLIQTFPDGRVYELKSP